MKNNNINFSDIFSSFRSKTYGGGGFSSSEPSSSRATFNALVTQTNVGGKPDVFRLKPAVTDDLPQFVLRALEKTGDGNLFVRSSTRGLAVRGVIGLIDRVLVVDCEERISNNGNPYLVCRTLERVQKWNLVIANKEMMASEHIPLPLPQFGYGPTFLTTVLPQQENSYQAIPGKWCSFQRPLVATYKSGSKICLDVVYEQRQWTSREQLESSKTLAYDLILRIWEEQLPCLSHNIDVIQRILDAKCITFTVSCCVDANYPSTSGSITLKVLGVQWHFESSLQDHGVSLSPHAVHSILDATQGIHQGSHSFATLPSSRGVVNVTLDGLDATRQGDWRFYALTNRPDEVENEEDILSKLEDDDDRPFDVIVMALRNRQQVKLSKKEKKSKKKKRKVAN